MNHHRIPALNVAFQNLDILEEKSTVSIIGFLPIHSEKKSYEVRHSKKMLESS
jgi:hypothetical protein